MTINLDFSGILTLLDLPLGTAIWRIMFWYFGWLPIAIVAFWGLLQFWLLERREAWEHHQKFILLAIDVPRNNEQSLLAVENLLTYFAGGHGSFTLIEKWWDGKFQLPFSLEIVSIGGYIQFLVYAPAHFKTLVESAVYSQYPDAEIYEVEDYTKVAPNKYPDEDYDIWGAELVQTDHEALPIRTYPQFEHDFGQPEKKFRDPMASLMDLMSSLRKGEQLWYQIILVPTGTAWKKEIEHFIDHELGKAQPVTKGNALADKMLGWVSDMSEWVYQLWGHVEDDKAKKDKALSFVELDPLKKARIEAAHRKVQKLGFEVSFRMIYVSRREVINHAKVVNGFFGYLKQFNTNDLNGLKPDTKMTMTSASYFFTKYRIKEKKNSLMRGYKLRSELIGRKPWIMNVEEIATLWHFPIDAVTKAPLMQRAAAKRIEPPMDTPFEDTANKVLVKDPIFDPNYVIQDDNEVVKTSSPKPAQTKAPDRPGFFEESDQTVVEESIPVKNITHSHKQTNSSEENVKGQPPANLPLG